MAIDASTAAGGIRFCSYCGEKTAFEAAQCSKCGALTGYVPPDPHAAERSEKKFGVAITLCAVFGLLGIHHFYIGNILHGIVDVSLFLGAITMLAMADIQGVGSYAAIGALLLVVDSIHSAAVFTMLIIGKQRDGRGRLILYPGQRI